MRGRRRTRGTSRTRRPPRTRGTPRTAGLPRPRGNRRQHRGRSKRTYRASQRLAWPNLLGQRKDLRIRSRRNRGCVASDRGSAVQRQWLAGRCIRLTAPEWGDSDGSIVAAGYSDFGDGLREHAVLIGLTPACEPDPTFWKLSGGIRLAGDGTSTDSTWGRHGTQAVQSEGKARLPTDEDRGRNVVVLPDDRTVHVGRYGGIPAVFVLTADGQLDTAEGNVGIFELPHPNVDSQFFNVALSSDGARVAATTNANDNGARHIRGCSLASQ